MGPEVFVQSGEPVLQLSCLGVSQFERDGHGCGENVSNTKGWIIQNIVNTWQVLVTLSLYLGIRLPELGPARSPRTGNTTEDHS